MSSHRFPFSELKRRLERLAVSLLPAEKTAGDYTQLEQDRIHAYVVLAHAELESYLEQLAIFVADQARRKSTPENCAPVISRLIVYKSSHSDKRIEPATVDAINGAAKYFEKLIEKNHGIKSANVYQMFMPLGITHRDLETVLLANLDAFGQFRGDIAHTSARLRQGSSPSSEKQRVNNILLDLAHFDQKVRALS